MRSVAVAAARAAVAIACLGRMHAGRIGLNWANRTNARGCGFPGAVTDTAGLTLIAAIERRRSVIGRCHDMNLAMAVFARRKFYPCRSLYAMFPVDADRLNLDDVVVTGCAIDRVEPAAMLPTIGADMTVEAFGCAMHGGLELCEVNFVTIVTGICLFLVARQQRERGAGKEEDEPDYCLAHCYAPCSRSPWYRNAYTYYVPVTPISQYPETARNTDFRAAGT